jgi:hypothetical protein
MRNTYRILAGKLEGKRQRRRPRRRWEYKIGMNLRQIRWEGVDWIHVGKDRDLWRAVVKEVVNLRIPFLHCFGFSILFRKLSRIPNRLHRKMRRWPNVDNIFGSFCACASA